MGEGARDMRADRSRYRTALVALVALSLLVSLVAPVAANPFETLPEDHWSYAAVKTLSRKGFLQRYIEDRLLLGYKMTYFDLAMWLGEAMGRLAPAGEPAPSLLAIVAAHNGANPDHALDDLDKRQLAELVGLVRDQLEILGYPIPAEVGGEARDGIRLDSVARALENFRMRGESRIIYQDVRSVDAADEERLGANVEQSHTLHVSGSLSDRLNVGAVLRTESRVWSGEEDNVFRIAAPGIDLGIPGAAVARFGTVTGAGISDLAVGGVRELSGFQAAFQSGQLGSTLLLARARVSDGDDEETPAVAPLVTAVDSTVQVTEQLQLGATVAYRSGALEPSDGASEAVVSLGGTYAVSPQLTLTTQIAHNPTAEDGGGALRLGAVLHPGPELTLGALLSTFDLGYRSLFDSGEGARARVDLSAEIGRWILSLRREHVVAESGEEGRTTRLGLASYLNENTVLRAAREVESGADGSAGDAQKSELDLEIRFELGKLGLGFAVESDKKGAPASTVRRTHATLEHAVGPIGRATAGFSLVDQEMGSEASSNLGLRYDFDDASVMLRYEIFTKVGEVKENVTTAEVSIKF